MKSKLVLMYPEEVAWQFMLTRVPNPYVRQHVGRPLLAALSGSVQRVRDVAEVYAYLLFQLCMRQRLAMTVAFLLDDQGRLLLLCMVEDSDSVLEILAETRRQCGQLLRSIPSWQRDLHGVSLEEMGL